MNAERVAAIIAQLDTGDDAPTGQEFKLSADGSLASAPTRRLALLNELTRLDPKAAAAQAAKILREFKSSDEWAVALRACALAHPTPEGRAYLTERFQAMIGHEPWLKEPSVGFLEAFDVAVHVGGTELMPALTDLVRRTNNQAVAHAAYLALDRLTIAEPASTLNHLLRQPDAMKGREITRANFFARADVSDAPQKKILENYLLSFAPAPAELNAFAGLYPSANFMISHNLLTPTPTPEGSQLARQDAAALAVVENWLADPRFEKLRPQLQKIKPRLSHFVPPP